MAIAKILLYYVFTPLSDPDAVRLWQHSLCESLGLRGRILISPHGLNGTVGGDIDACKAYIKATRQYPAFKDIDFKWSDGTGLAADGSSLDFPKLVVRAREEIVSFGVPEELAVDEDGVVGGGIHLSPEEVDALVAERDDVVFLDGRNRIEAEVGRFEGAVVPEVDNTHDFIRELDSGAWDHLKDKPIISYCTGGVRCEVLSSLMINRGFNEVYQIDGGIVRYAEKYGTSSHWKGALTVFDGREVVEFSDDPPISACHRCATPVARLQNCSDPACRVRLVTCEECGTTLDITCDTHALFSDEPSQAPVAVTE